MNTLRNIGTKWYHCPKGHAYTIGECGLAMIESICPECGERIGGKDHKLLNTNKLVDFDKDVKDHINISPVKIIKKNDKDKKDENKDNKKEIINDTKKEEINYKEDNNQNCDKDSKNKEIVSDIKDNNIKIQDPKNQNIQKEKEE